MSEIQTHLDKNREGEIICPKCGKTKTITAALDLIVKPTVNVKCACGHRFAISFDRRKFKRKDVRIPGTIHEVDSNHTFCDVTIISLASGGLSFETKSLENFAIDSILEIEFPLGDSEIIAREQITIKHLSHFLVGAEFSQTQYDHDLDFYISSTIAET